MTLGIGMVVITCTWCAAVYKASIRGLDGVQIFVARGCTMCQTGGLLGGTTGGGSVRPKDADSNNNDLP